MSVLTAPASSTEVVSVRNLKVRYGDTVAVDDVSFSIRPGEIFGILGPNGAGKTTTVECIAGLRRPDSGAITVLGRNVATDARALRDRVGVQLQTSELPDKIQVREALELFASFYPDPREPADLLALLRLQDKATTRYGNLSGGQRQRLSIALALVGRPELAILDELTTGLDPQSRRETWKLIEGIRDEGLTVILVTHFMEEAEYLCDRVALLHHGRVRAIDTPVSLGAGLGQRISFRASDELDLDALRARPEVRAVSEQGGRRVVEGTGDLVAAVIAELVAQGVVPEQTRVEQSTLDDAFVALTAQADAELAAAQPVGPA
ncbi:MAG TPA: ABC transporter ATP-binding protein [Solirubrobacteraceae bacterium]|nr:ABC transporter ATP-binding protein [Solirubrobacteraceae bacterium]